MKVCTYVRDGRERLGFISGSELIDARDAAGGNAPEFADMLAFIRSGEAGRKAVETAIAKAPASARVPLASAKLAPPIRPSTMLCSGSNYTDHNKEKANTPISGKEPEFFVKTADCVIGPGEHIIHDEKFTRKLDAETELAIVIGKPGRHIPVERALEHVFGYTIVNDVTARDLQVRTNPQGFTWYEVGRGKCFETSAPTGPWIVTADEIGDPQNLRLRTRINGELRQSASTGNMIFSCAQLIHFFSASMTLKPGMIIITGTPGGTAWSTDPELGGKWVGGDGSEKLVPARGYCKPGDVIECEMEKIGVLRNVVATA
ncbi:MAG: fumarylacetoacetate hydrolase family protein [Betaproteobacteria bacterium]|nr:fumarylacetoacetate hydrolase family protein [Betaproteobacteria bacterium]